MTVEEFLAGNHVRRADIVLCRGKKGAFSRLIRWATGSYFSHAALVFLTPDRDHHFNNTFLIESVTSGVDLTDLRHYVVDHVSDYDVAILRYEAPWFTGDHACLVRGVMLDFIKADYDFTTVWQIAWTVAKRLVFCVQAGVTGLQSTLERTYAQGRLAPGQFICSGFIQYGFYDAIDRMVRRGVLPEACLSEVLFRPGLQVPPDHAMLMSTTPEDLASSPLLNWRYLIVRGTVHPVTSRDEAYGLLRSVYGR
jgi:hypothetical protein